MGPITKIWSWAPVLSFTTVDPVVRLYDLLKTLVQYCIQSIFQQLRHISFLSLAMTSNHDFNLLTFQQ